MIIFLSLRIDIGSLSVGIGLHFYVEKVISHRAYIVIFRGMRMLKDFSARGLCLLSNCIELRGCNKFSFARMFLLCVIKFLN